MYGIQLTGCSVACEARPAASLGLGSGRGNQDLILESLGRVRISEESAGVGVPGKARPGSGPVCQHPGIPASPSFLFY